LDNGTGLLHEIAADLADELPRRVYADWLVENAADNLSGHSSAKEMNDLALFIRLQLSIARGLDYASDDANEKPLTPQMAASYTTRADELLTLHRVEWEAPIRQALGTTCQKITFHRGFPSIVAVNGIQQLIDSRILESNINTLTGLTVSNLGDQLPQLLAIPGINRLTTLNLGNNHIRNAGATAIAGSPHLANLTTLNLGNNDIGEAGAEVIAGSRHLKSLTTLILTNNGIGDAGAAAIANSPYLANLTTLNLWSNRIGEAGARAIAGSEHLKSLTTLDLGGNDIGPAGARALAGSPNLMSLTTLDLGVNDIGPEGARAIADSPQLANLTTLDLWANAIGPAGATAIAGSLHLKSLTTLLLRDNHIGRVGATAIVGSPHLSPLAKISGLNSAGFNALAERVKRDVVASLQQQDSVNRPEPSGDDGHPQEPLTKWRARTGDSFDGMDTGPDNPGRKRRDR
jgi:uncharacterized protein (TIGR02996 family)